VKINTTKCKTVRVIHKDALLFRNLYLSLVSRIFSSLFHNHTYHFFNIHVISAIYINVASVTYKGILKNELTNALMPRILFWLPCLQYVEYV